MDENCEKLNVLEVRCAIHCATEPPKPNVLKTKDFMNSGNTFQMYLCLCKVFSF